MSSAAESPLVPFLEIDQLREARAIVRQEAAALLELAKRLDGNFTAAVRAIEECRGCVVVSGIGKAGLIGRKIAATLSSTGTAPISCIRPKRCTATSADSARGTYFWPSPTAVKPRNCAACCRFCGVSGIPVIALTANGGSTLGSQADVTVAIGELREAGALGLAPTTSTTAMLALGDALALVLNRLKGLTPQDFAFNHPGGNLGRRLTTVGEIMRQGDSLRIAAHTATIREVFVQLSHPGRRTGAVMLVDDAGALCGLFTDSDLARLLEQRRDNQLDRSIAEVMTRNPLTIRPEAMLGDIVEVLSHKKVSELPVVDENGRPVGLVDITDVICQWPPKQGAATVYRAKAS